MALSLLPKKGEKKVVAEGVQVDRQKVKPAEWPSTYKPSLLLIPPSIISARKYQRTLRTTFGVVAGVAGLSLLVGGGSLFAAMNATSAVGEIEARVQQTRNEVARLKPVDEYYAGFTTRRQAVATALNADVDYSLLMDGISESLLPGFQVRSMETQFGTSCPGPNPYSSSQSIGCITLSVLGSGMTDAGVFAENLSAKPGLADAYVQSAASSEEGVEYLVTVNMTPEGTEEYPLGALSGKYRQFAGEPANGAGDGTTTGENVGTESEGDN